MEFGKSPIDYKVNQHRMWASVATGWEKWWPTFEQGTQIISDRMVELYDRILMPTTSIILMASQ